MIVKNDHNHDHSIEFSKRDDIFYSVNHRSTNLNIKFRKNKSREFYAKIVELSEGSCIIETEFSLEQNSRIFIMISGYETIVGYIVRSKNLKAKVEFNRRLSSYVLEHILSLSPEYYCTHDNLKSCISLESAIKRINLISILNQINKF